MAMKKRILGCLVSVGLMMAQVLCVGATEGSGSKGAQIDLTDKAKEDGYLINVTDTEANEFWEKNLFDELFPGVREKLGDRKAITTVIEIDAGTAEKVPSAEDPEKEVYEVSLYIPFLNEALFANDKAADDTDTELTPEEKALLNNLVAFLYWGDSNWDDVEWDSEEWLEDLKGDGEYSIITYLSYDLETCTVTFEIEELPACMILFAEVPDDFEAVGVSPQTLGDF